MTKKLRIFLFIIASFFSALCFAYVYIAICDADDIKDLFIGTAAIMGYLFPSIVLVAKKLLS